MQFRGCCGVSSSLSTSFFELGSLTGPQTYQSAGLAVSELQGSACVHLPSSHPELPVDTAGGGYGGEGN